MPVDKGRKEGLDNLNLRGLDPVVWLQEDDQQTGKPDFIVIPWRSQFRMSFTMSSKTNDVLNRYQTKETGFSGWNQELCYVGLSC